jgi:hypothetical protein
MESPNAERTKAAQTPDAIRIPEALPRASAARLASRRQKRMAPPIARKRGGSQLSRVRGVGLASLSVRIILNPTTYTKKPSARRYERVLKSRRRNAPTPSARVTAPLAIDQKSSRPGSTPGPKFQGDAALSAYAI